MYRKHGRLLPLQQSPLRSGEFLATMFPEEIQQGRIYLMTQDRIHFWSPLLYVDAFQRLSQVLPSVGSNTSGVPSDSRR